MKVGIDIYRERRSTMKRIRHKGKPVIRQILVYVEPVKYFGKEYLDELIKIKQEWARMKNIY